MTLQQQPSANTSQPAGLSTAQNHADLLVAVGAHQDKDAFITLFEYFAPRIKSYLLKNGANETEAEEIVQNTFVSVWEKAGSYNPQKSAASTWIFTIARNKRIDTLRREKFIEIVDSDDDLLQNLAQPITDDYVDEATLEKLTHAMSALPEEQSKLVRMAFFDDMSHQAISDKTALPLGTVKSRLRLAMEKLQKSLKGSKP